MEEYTPETQQTTQSDKFKRWFQDNLRIIVSVVIVVLIAGGIYSYSKRSASPIAADQTQQSEQSSDQQTDVANPTDNAANSSTSTEKKTVSAAASSQETATSFIQTAGKGDGTTLLARAALANYLEKTPDSSLTKEHKIYIEDYLRKHVGYKGSVHVGTSVEFSKDLIQKAIDQSKTLNQGQLNNLKKYSARAASLS